MGTVCTFARNETLFDEGEKMSASYKVVSGVVRLCRVTADGRRQIAGFRLPGDLIGMEWTDEYEMTAEAVRDVVAVRYARTRLERLSQEKPWVRDHLLDHLRRDLRSAQEHLIILGRQTATERVASFLLHLARRADAAEGAVIDMQLGRQDIAGLSRPDARNRQPHLQRPDRSGRHRLAEAQACRHPQHREAERPRARRTLRRPRARSEMS